MKFPNSVTSKLHPLVRISGILKMLVKNLVILALCVLPAFSAPSPLVKVQKAREPITGRHIVTLKESANRQANIDPFDPSSITHKWDIINGFAGSFSEAEVEALRSNIQTVRWYSCVQFRPNAPWGLGRISSQTKLANQNTSALTFSYDYDSTAGSGATIYIIGAWNQLS